MVCESGMSCPSPKGWTKAFVNIGKLIEVTNTILIVLFVVDAIKITKEQRLQACYKGWNSWEQEKVLKVGNEWKVVVTNECLCKQTPEERNYCR